MPNPKRVQITFLPGLPASHFRSLLPLILLLVFTVLLWRSVAMSTLELAASRCYYPHPGPCPSALEQALLPFIGRSLILLDYSDLARSVQAQLPHFSLSALSPNYPHGLRLDLQERPASLVIFAQNTGQVMVVDNNLTVLTVATAAAVVSPYIKVNQLTAHSVGEQIRDPDITAAAELYQLLRQNGVPLKFIDSTAPPTILVTLTDAPQALFTRLSDLSTAVASLQLILRSPTINLETTSIIDVRFNKPVLKPNQ